jgi:hypothetical protein
MLDMGFRDDIEQVLTPFDRTPIYLLLGDDGQSDHGPHQ